MMILGFLLSLAAEAFAGDIEIRTDFKLSAVPLTTEKVGKLDPHQEDPHLQRWIVSRHVELMGLQAVKRKNGRYGVIAHGIQSVAEGYLRGLGPWYQPLTHFSCEKKPNEWFATQEGTQEAVGIAGALWSEKLKEEKMKISLLLGQVSESTEALALDQGEQVFRRWISDVETRWRNKAAQAARKQEWNSYVNDTASLGLCTGKKAVALPPSIKTRMEPIQGSPPSKTQLLARAPARLWDGYFSVRLNVSVGTQNLNGRFLIDPSIPKSLISPTWLESQGMVPALLLVPGTAPERVTLHHLGQREGGSSLAPRIQVGKVQMGGFELPLKEFLLLETEFFAPPESVTTCCDGVLGKDFLRQYPVEFDPGVPSEVRVWPRENFHWASEVPWVEVNEVPETALVGSGRFTLDLPHGRLWLSPEYEKKGALKSNLSGLSVEFREVGGERILFVKDMKPNSPARSLVKMGLKPGMPLTHVDGKLVGEMDLWEVERRLAGDYGRTVTLQWQTSTGTKLVPFSLDATISK